MSRFTSVFMETQIFHLISVLEFKVTMFDRCWTELFFFCLLRHGAHKHPEDESIINPRIEVKAV